MPEPDFDQRCRVCDDLRYATTGQPVPYNPCLLRRDHDGPHRRMTQTPQWNQPMPEPDFNQIARDSVGWLHSEDDPDPAGLAKSIEEAIAHIADQLRQVWNARGAADELLLRKYMAFREGSKDDEGLRRTLHTLDR